MDVLQSVLVAIMPSLLDLAALVIAAAIAWAANAARTHWGVEIEARHREALHSALMSGVRAALSRGLAGSAAVEAAIDYAGKSVPDAIEALGPGVDVLADIARAKLREAGQ